MPDHTSLVQGWIDDDHNNGRATTLPAGTYTVETLMLYSNTVLRGAGKHLTKLQHATGSTSPLLKRHTSETGAASGVQVSDLSILGVDGQGGTGVELVSFLDATFLNVNIDFFRNAGDTGIGLLLNNHATYGNCAYNTFINVRIANCDTGLKMTSASGTYSSGYCNFFGLLIYQEKKCIEMLAGAGNGSIYNLFCGLKIQGAGSGTMGIYCEGDGNAFYHTIMDNVSGTEVEFPAASSGNNILGSFDLAQVVNGSPAGAANTMDGQGRLSGGMGSGHSFLIQDMIDGETTVTIAATGNNTPELRFQEDATIWRAAMDPVASPTKLEVIQPDGNIVQEWLANRTAKMYGDFEFNTNAIGPILVDTATGARYRLKVTSGSLGLTAL